MPPDALRYRTDRLARADWRTVALLAAVAGWATLVVSWSLGAISPPGPAALLPVVLLAVPGALLGVSTFAHVPVPSILPIAWGSALVAAAIVAGAAIVASPVIALLVPGIVVATGISIMRPSWVVIAAFAISGFYGSLIAFWHVPVEALIGLAIAGLVGAVVVRFARERDRPFVVWPATLALGSYVAFSITGVAVADSRSIAYEAFTTNGLYMLLALVIGYAGWRPNTHDLIARGLLAAALLVGAYATLRWQIGPAKAESDVARRTIFNSVDGELKTQGSFPAAQDLGVWAGAVIPFCVACALCLENRRWRLIGAAGAILCMIGLLASQLRSGLIGVVLGLLIVVLLYQATSGLPGLRLGTSIVASIVAVAVIAVAFSFTGRAADEEGNRSFSRLLTDTRSDASVDARLYKWEQAVIDLRDRPFGYGVGTASFAQQTQGRFYVSVGDYNVDNGYLKIALEQGFTVMTFFILTILALILALGRRAVGTRDRRSACFAIGACGSLAGTALMLNAGAYLDAPRALALWVIVGLGLAQFTTAPVGRDAQPLDPTP